MGDSAVAGKFCVLTMMRRGLPTYFSSRFDPIFFLHHANVDCMVSLWTAVSPGVCVTCSPAEGGTFIISGTANVDNNTSMLYRLGSALGFLTSLTHYNLDLTPFWNSHSEYLIGNHDKHEMQFEYTAKGALASFISVSDEDEHDYLDSRGIA